MNENNDVQCISKNDALPKFISEYQEEGRTYYQVYVNLRSKKIATVREQRRILGITTLKEAHKLRDKWLVDLTKRIAEREAKGLTWGEIVYKWERYWKQYPSRTFNAATLHDHVARMTNWTESWWIKPACEITIGDAREVMKNAYENDASLHLRKAVKQTINQVFKWGLEEKLIPGMDRSPARDIEILCAGESRPDERRKEILTSAQISKLLETAEDKEHSWYPIWFMALHSGMRTSELEALRKEKVELVPLQVAKTLDALPDGDERKNYGFIHVEWAWKNKEKRYGPTKAHYWRTVPINSELYYFLMDYLPKANFGRDDIGERVFAALPNWKRGGQAKVLRLFCEANALISIKFHTLRACFATQLLGLGVPEDKVMKVGGWSDVETMRIYVRLAGILEHGSTEGLKYRDGGRKFDPNSPYFNTDYQRATELLSEDNDDESEDDVCTPVLAPPRPKVETGNVLSLQAFRQAKAK